MSDKYIIQGGTPLKGEVSVSGSKNSALGIIAAAMALDGPCVIENLPKIQDIRVLLTICEELGAKIEWINGNTISFDPAEVKTHTAISENVSKIRGSYYLLGAFLGKFKKVSLLLPGGCDFGSRPIDLHIKGFQALGGGDLREENGVISIEANHLKGAGVFLDMISVGATINIMLAAVKAEGVTVINNAAKEPHIVDVANFLNTMGADIRGAGTDVIKITGKPYLEANRSYTIIPDQIEAGTYMIMAAMTHGDITCTNLIPKHMEPLSAKLIEMGALVEEGDDSIRVALLAEDKLKAVSFKTMPYPGFPTDLQPQATTLLTSALGTGRMIESVWENRFQYIKELQSMGANIVTSGKLAVVQGSELHGTTVFARDLRAGAALVTAGLMAKGQTTVTNVYAIERGYENFVDKLKSVRAQIEVVP
ncbi:MAG TPA: UDP-N-acetylglucosamine 1-carboxyvinyltransferase [Candidatus Eisenbacteria bacterium]|nr:UDP-N-acetylglucosamine 1-carboxyvinyltransferase [Candidatus Eisenbacteria bacterium]